jgi:toxin CptA
MQGLVILTIAAVCAALMGFAVQRGATCMVAAVDEIVSKRSANRLIAMLEASAIVAGGIILARFAGHLAMQPATYQLTAWTLLGGAIMGVGAFVARACVFGAIARIGSGEWAYLLVPLGFLLGCVAARPLLSVAPPLKVAPHSILLDQAALVAAPLLALAGWRLWRTLTAARERRLNEYVWSPHVATGVIGLTFVIMFLTVGAWAYTQVLAEASRGMAMMVGSRMILLVALFTGAILGGWTAGKLKFVRPNRTAVVRCLAGGALLGFGGMLVPGNNDGLILVGLPLLQPYAWAALASMIFAIYLAFKIERRVTDVAAKPKLA